MVIQKDSSRDNKVIEQEDMKLNSYETDLRQMQGSIFSATE